MTVITNTIPIRKGDDVESKFYWNWYFIGFSIEPKFPYQNSFTKFSLLKTLLSKLVLTTSLNWVIFRTNFLGIGLIANSIVFFFLEVQKVHYLWGLYRGIFYGINYLFPTIVLYVEVLCVVFSLYVVSILSCCMQSFIPFICFKFVSIKYYEVVLLKFDSPLHVEVFLLT